MTDHTEDRNLIAAAGDLPARYLECRMNGHRWVRQGEPTEEGRGLYVIHLRCTSCRCRRHDRVTASGTLYARWYERPDGFDIRGFGHATRRAAPYRRVLIDRTDGSSVDA